MKKLLSIMVLLLINGFIYAQTYFEGVLTTTVDTKYETNTEAITNTMKKNIDDNESLTPAQKAMSKGLLKPIIKNMLKKLNEEKYITAYPDGAYEGFSLIQGGKNREIAYVPKLGRIIVKDHEKGDFIIAFPKFKIAYKQAFPPDKDVETNYKKVEEPTKDEIFMIDGFRCINNYALFEYEKIGGEMIDTVTYNGVLCVKQLAPGYRLADYNIAKIYEINNEYMFQSINMTKMEATSINDQNFTLPSDYEMIPSITELGKIIQKKIKKGESLEIPYDGTLPNLIWDVVK